MVANFDFLSQSIKCIWDGLTCWSWQQWLSWNTPAITITKCSWRRWTTLNHFRSSEAMLTMVLSMKCHDLTERPAIFSGLHGVQLEETGDYSIPTHLPFNIWWWRLQEKAEKWQCSLQMLHSSALNEGGNVYKMTSQTSRLHSRGQVETVPQMTPAV